MRLDAAKTRYGLAVAHCYDLLEGEEEPQGSHAVRNAFFQESKALDEYARLLRDGMGR